MSALAEQPASEIVLEWGEVKNRSGTTVHVAYVMAKAERDGSVLTLRVAPGRGGWKQWFVATDKSLRESGRSRTVDDAKRAAEACAERMIRSALERFTRGRS